MKNKILSIFLFVMFALAQTSFASVGVKVDGESAGEATVIDLITNGGDVTTNGSDFKIPVIGANMIAAGLANGGATSMTTAQLAVPIGYGFIRKEISSDAAFSAGTMADGTPGQILTLFITARAGSGTFVLTPTTKTGFISVTFDAIGDMATFWYVDDTDGWVLLSHTACTVTIP